MIVRRLLTAASGGTGSGFSRFDDEFSDTTNHGWTVSGSNGVDFDTTTASCVHMQSGMVIHRARIPATPFTVTAYLSAVTLDDINTVYANASLMIGEATPASSPGPIMWGPEMPDVDILGRTARYDGRFANFGATPTHLGTKIEAVGHVYDVPTYQRIVVHSATNMDILYSTDNVTYSTYATGLNPTLTPGAILLVSFGCTTDWDWVRFT